MQVALLNKRLSALVPAAEVRSNSDTRHHHLGTFPLLLDGRSGSLLKTQGLGARALPTETKVESANVSKQKWNLC